MPETLSNFSGAGGGFASQITIPLTPVSGYFRRFRVTVIATGGTGAVTALYNKDAPWNVVQQVILKDASGNVNIINLPGWEALHLLPIISGGFGLERYNDPASWPYYKVSAAFSTNAGGFAFQTFLPLEFGGEAVGCIGGDNASVLPTLQWFTNSTGVVYATPPTTLPNVNIQVDADFWWNPDQPDLLPDGLGSSRQYNLLTGSPSVVSGFSGLVTLPKFGGGFIDSITFICRDSLNLRTDTAWPLRIQLFIDNVAYINETIDQCIFDMYNVLQLQGGTGVQANDSYYNGAPTVDVVGSRPVGVLHFSFRNGVSQIDTGLLQSGLDYISTTPGTNVQLSGTGFQNIFADANTPYTFTCIIGLVVPAGTLVTT